jgi:hypothetical protein
VALFEGSSRTLIPRYNVRSHDRLYVLSGGCSSAMHIECHQERGRKDVRKQRHGGVPCVEVSVFSAEYRRRSPGTDEFAEPSPLGFLKSHFTARCKRFAEFVF